MTTPTQAQIEAAAKIIWNDVAAKHGGSWESRKDDEIVKIQIRATARAALTAAAQTGEQEKRLGDCFSAAQVGEQYPNEATRRAVGWDAQVGEQDEYFSKADFLMETKLIEAATIERCAQVCDEAANDPRAIKEYRYFCINMAAAIRRLRDKT